MTLCSLALCQVEAPLICQLGKRINYIAANKPLYLAFVDLEKAFDRVPRKVLWWVLRNLGVKEWAVRVIQGMYMDVKCRFRVNRQYSEEFWVGVGVQT